jgi:hypothetical protein
MRAGKVWMLTAALALGAVGGRAAAQEPATDAGQKPGWFARWFGKKETPKPPPAKEPGKKEEPRVLPGPETTAAIHLREKAELDRRQAVCEKLQLIAMEIEKSDREAGQTLMRRAKELDQRAWALYQQRTAAPTAAAGGFQSDEKTLQRHLGGAAAGDDAPLPPNLTIREIESSNSRLAVRREQP